jgi:Domain of unknown function DUF29
MTTQLQQTPIKNLELYQQDHYLWMVTTAKLLRDRRLEQIDFEHLIEEIEEMGKDKQRELKSRLVVLLMHIRELLTAKIFDLAGASSFSKNLRSQSGIAPRRTYAHLLV